MATGPTRPTRTLLAVNPSGVGYGAESVLLRVLDAARRAGWHPVVASPDGPFAERVSAAGFEHVALPFLKLPGGPRSIGVVRAVVAAARAARRLRAVRPVDVVIGNGLLTLPALRLARLRRPTILFVHDVIARRDWRVMVRACSRAVAVAVAPSEAAAEPVRELGLPTRVVRNGTPWPVAPVSAEPSSPPVVGVMGALAPNKGQDVLLEAVAQLSRDDVVVELVGEPFAKGGAYVTRLRQRAGQPGLAGRVRFVPHVADALDRMRGWTVAVLPSVYPECAPLSLLEAMSVGLPVVATDHGGPSEIVDGAGILVPPSEVAPLAEALQRLIGREDLRRQMGETGRRRIASQLNLEHQEAEILRMLEALSVPPRPGVAWVVPDFVPGLGGTSTQTRIIAGALMRRGHPVHVVTRRRDRTLPKRESIDGLLVRRVGLPGNGFVAEKTGLLAVAVALLRRRRRSGVVFVLMYPDFVLSTGLAGLRSRTVMGWAGLGDATDALAATGGPARRLAHALRRRVLRACTNLVLVTAMGRELAQVGIESELVPLPLDTDRFRPPTPEERRAVRADLGLDDELVVVYSGQLRRIKAADRLVAAFESFVARGRRARLLLVGGASGTDDACEHELREQIAAAGLESRVTITGTVADVVPYLWAADIFVLPSVREGTSYSLLEAMACGVACITPEEPIGREVLGDAGAVPPDNDPASLLACLVDLADDPDERARLGKAAAEAVHHYELDRVVDRYEEILNRGGRL
jgi:glycosyltransferase involved in cell wall biosynthesis